eukprot:scaffold137723_cov32-Tisochrysis_lutea.AAC.3
MHEGIDAAQALSLGNIGQHPGAGQIGVGTAARVTSYARVARNCSRLLTPNLFGILARQIRLGAFTRVDKLCRVAHARMSGT